MLLTTAQLDRASGTLLASACGDALGARFEFGPPLGPDVDLTMQAGGSFGWAPGEWTDDTSMAVAIAEVSAEGADLLSRQAQDRIVARWAHWSTTAKDVGVMTSSVLRNAIRAGADEPTAADSLSAAADYHYRTGRSAGNGSLMRTGPVALAYLDDPHGLVDAAMALSALTHYDPEAGEACALWCLAIRHAVLCADFEGLRDGLNHLPPPRAAVWAERLDRAEVGVPADFSNNGWVVEALQGAWSAITTSRSLAGRRDDANHLERALEAAVRGGRDTDTVAAIAGSLLGARWGASAVPLQWRRVLHGWPGLRASDLIQLGALTARGGRPDREDWPSGEP